jgi:hypothetical protein
LLIVELGLGDISAAVQCENEEAKGEHIVVNGIGTEVIEAYFGLVGVTARLF